MYSHSRLSTFEQCPHKFKLRYIDKIPEAKQTIAVEFHTTVFSINDSENDQTKIQIWDLGGQEQFKNMGMFRDYCRGADGAILCFDLTDISSLFTLPEWIDFLEPDILRFLIEVYLKLELRFQYLERLWLIEPLD